MTFILVENKGNMDKKAFLLLLGYIGYLFLGAAVFLHLEKSNQEDNCKYANATLQMEILDFGNQYFYDLGLNRKLCKGIHRLDELYATASDHSHKDQVTELFTLWAEDDCSEEQYGAVLYKLSSESMNDTKFKEEFSEVYGELIKFAGFESFDEEHFNITGAVFRNLMSRGVGIVTENYFNLIESCAEKWTFHSAFFFAGTVATTIGYGQLVPSTDESRIFCIIFAVIGIPYFAYMTSVISQSINNGLDRLTKRFGVMTSRLIYVLGGIFILIIVPVVGFIRIEEWTLVEAIYFSLISLSTIGFGDLVPREEPPEIYATHINNITACYDTLTNPIPRSSNHVDPSQGDCKPNVYPEAVELGFDVYRVCVFFWILTGLTWLGGIIQMVCSLVSNSRKDFSKTSSMTETYLVGDSQTKVPACTCCADCIFRQKIANGKSSSEKKLNNNSNGSVNLNLSKV